MGQDIRPVLAFVILFFTFRSAKNVNHCEEAEQLNPATAVAWKASGPENNLLVLSDPPCYTKDNKLIVRTCTNGTFRPPSYQCRHLEKNHICPEEFLENRDKSTCIFVLKSRRDSCPFPGAKISTTKLKSSESRSSEDGSRSSESHSRSFEDDERENEEYRCVYKYQSWIHNCPDDCVAGGLGKPLCFCKYYHLNTTSASLQVAIPRYSFERKLLEYFVQDDICVVGGVQENSTHLSNAPVVLTKRGWSIFDGTHTPNCTIRTIDPLETFKQSHKMVLQFNSRSHKLYLTLYFLEYRKNENLICFTDSTGTLKQSVRVEKIWESSFKVEAVGYRAKAFKVQVKGKYPGRYWCELGPVRSNTVVGYKKKKGHEYVVRLGAEGACKPRCQGLDRYKEVFRNLKDVGKIRLMEIGKNYPNGTVELLFHLSMNRFRNVDLELILLRQIVGKRAATSTSTIKVLDFRNSELCVSETSYSSTIALHWPKNEIGKMVLPDRMCVDQNGEPVRRRCIGDFLYGAYWSEVQGTCRANATSHLHDLTSIPNGTIQTITEATSTPSNLTVLDIYYLSEILSKLQHFSESDLVNIIEAVDNSMKANSTVLKKSQNLLNSTNRILRLFDNLLSSATVENHVISFKRNNLLVHMSKPFRNNISGIVLYEEIKQNDFRVEHLKFDSALDTIKHNSSLEVAMYIPEDLLKQLVANLSEEEVNNFTIITTVFYEDRFFIGSDDQGEVGKKSVGSRIVSVTIPGFGEFLPTPVPIFFKPRLKNSYRECAFWSYEKVEDGYWSTVGGNYLGRQENSSLEVCSFFHLTHFALLVLNEETASQQNLGYPPELVEKHNQILSLITGVNCFFSLVGIFTIFTTALVFKTWREKLGTKILIQLSFSILLQIICIYLADLKLADCRVIGIGLHYSLVSKFCWMLVTAVMQFLRFVKIVASTPKHVLTKSCVVGWVLPILPIVTTLVLDPSCYLGRADGFCYPKGLGFYWGIFVPVSLIISVNLVVFVKVMWSIYVMIVEFHGKSMVTLKRQLYLAVLLFFLLGISWGFGVVAEVCSGDFRYVFMYLFCLTSTLEGFVLCVFYVVLDKFTRNLWLKQINLKISTST